MDVRLSEEQELLGQAVRAVCDRYSTPADVRALEGDERGYREDLWRELARMDVLGLLIPEEHGGSGWLPVELSVVSEELGRTLCPSPYIETAAFAATLLREDPDWAPRIASGDAVLTLAWHEPERSETEDGIGLHYTEPEDGCRLTGEKILVPFAKKATSMITLANVPDGMGSTIFLVDPTAQGVSLEFEGTLASDARYRVEFNGTVGRNWGAFGDGWDLFVSASPPALVAVAAYAVGAARRAHEMSVAYANERIQFDKPIGSYQAMAHPLADLHTEIEGARTLVHQAAWALSRIDVDTPPNYIMPWTLSERPKLHPLASMAKYYACDVFRRTAKFGHQVFGGIGFTLDIDIQLYMRRAKQLEVTWFGPRQLEEAIAAAELDAPEPLVTPDAVASGAKQS